VQIEVIEIVEQFNIISCGEYVASQYVLWDMHVHGLPQGWLATDGHSPSRTEYKVY
jgi:hypothetical protein